MPPAWKLSARSGMMLLVWAGLGGSNGSRCESFDELGVKLVGAL